MDRDPLKKAAQQLDFNKIKSIAYVGAGAHTAIARWLKGEMDRGEEMFEELPQEFLKALKKDRKLILIDPAYSKETIEGGFSGKSIDTNNYIKGMKLRKENFILDSRSGKKFNYKKIDLAILESICEKQDAGIIYEVIEKVIQDKVERIIIEPCPNTEHYNKTKLRKIHNKTINSIKTSIHTLIVVTIDICLILEEQGYSTTTLSSTSNYPQIILASKKQKFNNKLLEKEIINWIKKNINNNT